jgi:hypothetical protein
LHRAEPAIVVEIEIVDGEKRLSSPGNGAVRAGRFGR